MADSRPVLETNKTKIALPLKHPPPSAFPPILGSITGFAIISPFQPYTCTSFEILFIWHIQAHNPPHNGRGQARTKSKCLPNFETLMPHFGRASFANICCTLNRRLVVSSPRITHGPRLKSSSFGTPGPTTYSRTVVAELKEKKQTLTNDIYVLDERSLRPHSCTDESYEISDFGLRYESPLRITSHRSSSFGEPLPNFPDLFQDGHLAKNAILGPESEHRHPSRKHSPFRRAVFVIVVYADPHPITVVTLA